MTRPRPSFTLGVTLIAVGVAFLLNAIGLPVFRHLWKAWPLALVALGAAKLLRRRRGAPAVLTGPERILLVLVLVAGTVTTLTQGRRGRVSAVVPPRPREVARDRDTPPEVVRELRRSTLPALPGAPVEIDVEGADLEVTPGSGSEVAAVLSASRGVEAEQAGRLEELAEGGRVRLRYARGESARGARVALRVEAPAHSPLAIRHAGGELRVRRGRDLKLAARGSDIALEEPSGATAIEARNAEIEVKGGDGQIEVVSTFSNLVVADFAGGLTVRSSYGNLRLERLGGAVDVEASDGEVALSAIAAHARAVGPRLRILAEGLGGGAALHTSGGSVKADGVAGAVEVKAEASPVELAGVAGAVDVTATLRAVTVSGVHGPVRIRVADGPASVRECTDRIEVRARGGDVRLARNLGPATVAVEDGDVWVDSPAPSAEAFPLELDAERGNVTLSLRHGGARLDARAEPGRIVDALDSPLPIRPRGASASLQTTVRGGTAPVRIVARHGTVRIED